MATDTKQMLYQKLNDGLDLLGCPFCGHTKVCVWYDLPEGLSAKCHGCGASARPIKMPKSPPKELIEKHGSEDAVTLDVLDRWMAEQAAAAWNRRPSVDEK